ncbi:uncharacterized protein [Palaemon carinicauda]|uniref:uncharacterized protein n=1 Tax=Palaemon carinicauda TaxID=392227 RepID=UPI0035B5C24A
MPITNDHLSHAPTNDIYFDLLTSIDRSYATTTPDSELLRRNVQTVLSSQKHFLITDITLPILGEDFLSHFHLLIDTAYQRLVNADSKSSTHPQPAPSNLTFHICARMYAYAHFLTLSPELFCLEFCQIPIVSTKHDSHHYIKTTGPLVFTRFMHLAPGRLTASEQKFAGMEEMSLCRKASSRGSSPLYITLKKDGSHGYWHRITPEGVHSFPEKLASIQNFPKSSTVKALPEFLDIINYYHRFLPVITATLALLYTSLKRKLKDLKWRPLQEVAFCNAKNALSRVASLPFPVPHALLFLYTDASDVPIGAVIEQVANGLAQPWTFFSRKLSKAESGFFTFDRELLPTPGPPINANLSPPWLNTIAPFNMSTGEMNPVADTLSRNTLTAIHLGLDYNALVEA